MTRYDHNDPNIELSQAEKEAREYAEELVEQGEYDFSEAVRITGEEFHLDNLSKDFLAWLEEQLEKEYGDAP